MSREAPGVSLSPRYDVCCSLQPTRSPAAAGPHPTGDRGTPGTGQGLLEQSLKQAPFFFLLEYYFGGGNIGLNVLLICFTFGGAAGLAWGLCHRGRGAWRRSPRGASCPRPPVTVLLSPSPVSPASLVMLHTSLPLHIATGTLFSTTSRGRPARRAAEKPSAAARSPLPRHGAGGSAPRRDQPEPHPWAPAQGPRLSSPPRSISEMCLEDFFYFLSFFFIFFF